MKVIKNKKFITLIAISIILLLCLTGCNKQIIDINYSFDKAICKIGETTTEIKIKSWKDYEGEQLQLIDKDGNVYLVSNINCTLIKEEQ